jgi:hypothetical protein
MTALVYGRAIGVLVLLQLVAGVISNLVLTAPLIGDPGFLVSAQSHSVQVGVLALTGVFGCVLTVAIASIAYPLLSRNSTALAVAFVAMSVLAAGVSALEQASFLVMREFSERYQQADEASRLLMEQLDVAGYALRNSVHYLGLFVGGLTLGLWYFCLLRFALIPRALAAFGLAAVGLQLYAIAGPLLGGVVNFALLPPLALAQLLQGGWLLAFGIRAPRDEVAAA